MSNRRVCTLNESILKQGWTSVSVIVNKNQNKCKYHFKNQGSVNSCITSESRGDVTCDSLGDVTWSHGTHDVKRCQEGLTNLDEETTPRRSKPHSHVYEGVFTTVVSNK